jgi:hypothetical protein
MAMRDLVTGGAACAVPGSSSSSNPLGALANALVGSSSKIEVCVLHCNFFFLVSRKNGFVKFERAFSSTSTYLSSFCCCYAYVEVELWPIFLVFGQITK